MLFSSNQDKVIGNFYHHALADGIISKMEKKKNTQDEEARGIAEKWCKSEGAGWEVSQQLGRGGTAPVFEIKCPDGGLRALKIYDHSFSSGEKGEIERDRISQQIELKDHGCSSLVQVYDGGKFEDRLFVLMSRASGNELERRLADVPREKIRSIDVTVVDSERTT